MRPGDRVILCLSLPVWVYAHKYRQYGGVFDETDLLYLREEVFARARHRRQGVPLRRPAPLSAPRGSRAAGPRRLRFRRSPRAAAVRSCIPPTTRTCGGWSKRPAWWTPLRTSSISRRRTPNRAARGGSAGAISFSRGTTRPSASSPRSCTYDRVDGRIDRRLRRADGPARFGRTHGQRVRPQPKLAVVGPRCWSASSSSSPIRIRGCTDGSAGSPTPALIG